jgi:hypothetical protein
MARIVQVNLFQPILLEKSFEMSASGVVMSGMSIFEAIGASYATHLRKWISDYRSMMLVSLLSAASYWILSSAGSFGTVAALCTLALMIGVGFPIQRQLLNDSVSDSKHRATMLAIEAFIDRACCAGVVLMLGEFLEGAPASEFLFLFGSVAFVGILALGLVVQPVSSPKV